MALDARPGTELASAVTEIKSAANRARDLVRQILAFSRGQETEAESQALGPIITEVASLIRASLPAGVELALRIDDGTPWVVAAGSQIHQVLMNLVTNAWQAISGNSGRIEIQVDDVVLRSRATAVHPDLQPGRYARLRVTDIGSGMDPAVADRIFEPFFSTKTLELDTGLGLAVVHGIVRAHDGVVLVHSRPGAGSTFTIYFPAAPIAALPDVRPNNSGQAGEPGTAQVVAVVDDEAAIVRSMVRLLEKRGYASVGFNHADDFLRAFQANPGGFDAVLVDFNMPGRSGVDLAREALAIRPDLAIGLMSGLVTDELMAQATIIGLLEVVHKPPMAGEILEAVGRLLSRTAVGT